MGNYWKGHSNQLLLQYELQAFIQSGVDPATITQQDVNLDGNLGSQNYIHVVTCRSLSKVSQDKLVVLHGFGGGAGVFMRMAPLLQNYFEVVLIDLLGMGASGRPFYDIWDCADKATQYFTDSLQAVLDKLKINQSPFYLLGHSFGGMIAGEYAIKHPAQVKHLILMSPLGMPYPADRLNVDKIREGLDKDSYLQRIGFETADWLWNEYHPSPFEMSRALGFLTLPIIKKSLKRRLPNMKAEVIDIFAKYVHQIQMKGKGSEAAITVILRPFAFAKRPLVDRLPVLKIPFTFMYGDYDWMERETADQLIKENKISGVVFNVEEAGHHLYIEQPVSCVYNLLVRTHDQATADAFIATQ